MTPSSLLGLNLATEATETGMERALLAAPIMEVAEIAVSLEALMAMVVEEV